MFADAPVSGAALDQLRRRLRGEGSMITLRLPIPPSLNNMYPTVVRKEDKGSTALASAGRISRENYLAAVTGAKPNLRRIKSADYKKWIKAAGAMLLTQKAKTRGASIRGKWGVTIKMPLETPDLDNRIKPLLDFVVNLGLTPDDRHARYVLILESESVRDECEVSLFEWRRGLLDEIA
jgi:Holliday junction resolvase RusA-like endonuclease